MGSLRIYGFDFAFAPGESGRRLVARAASEPLSQKTSAARQLSCCQPFSCGNRETKSEAVAAAARRYYRMLARFTTSPRLIACQIDGRTQAGGLGLVAACDYAFCTPRSTFNLPEVLLGLVPAVVLPFLMRRIGWQRAYSLALTARTVDAAQALTLGLVDEVNADGEEPLRRLLLSMNRTPAVSLQAAKRYGQELWPLTAAIEEQAVAQISELLADPAALDTIRALQEHGLWQSSMPSA